MFLIEFASKSLQKGDKIKKTYSGKLDGDWGYLTISSQKLLFIKEKGLLKKTRTVTLNLPYSKIEKVNQEGRGEIIIKEIDEPIHRLTLDVPVNVVLDSINVEMRKNL